MKKRTTGGRLVEAGVALVLALVLLTLNLAVAGTIPSSEQPQVLVILDTSQSMAGNLQGAIMSGSGTVAANADSASPPCYSLNGYTPRSKLGPSNGGSCPSGTAPYTVSIGGILTDNSESMINVAEQSIDWAFNNSTYDNIMQAGLLVYATSGGAPAPYNTWVYYMSGDTPTGSGPFTPCSPGVFGYGASSSSMCAANDALAVPNPCYNKASGSGCSAIETELGSTLSTSPYLYINQTSDDAQINDVLYSTPMPVNFLAYDGTYPANPYPPTGYTLGEYEDQVVSGSSLLETYKYPAPPRRWWSRPNCLNPYLPNEPSWGYCTSPTDAGYIPYSGQVWYAERGLAFNGAPVVNGTNGAQGDLVVPVAPLNASQISLLNTATASEQFVQGGNEIVAGSGYGPTAGALVAALNDLTTSDQAPKPACAPKYVILITDGQPTMGLNGHVYPPLGSASALGYGENLSGGSSNDNAVSEAITAVTNLANYTSNGLKGIKTYVLGVGVGVNCPPSTAGCTQEAQDSYKVLQYLAKAGKTNVVYSADTAAAFQQAFNAILNNIAAQIVTASSGSSPQAVAGSSYEYVVTSTPSLGEGDLSAYLIGTNGTLAASPSWDVNSQMTTTNRTNTLYSEGPAVAPAAVGPVTALTSMDAAAFALPANSTLTPTIIENYTIDPSYSGGNYRGGRSPGWFVGVTTADKPTYMGPPNDARLLGNSSYDSYAQGETGRPPLVLFTDNDGFLYAVGANTGTPDWGWMPRPLVQYLQSYSTYWQGANMAGFRPRVVDAQAGGPSSAWSTYVVGGAEQGAIQYALQLDSSGTPSAEAWEQDNPGSVTPNAIAPAIFRLVAGSGTAYEATVLNTTNTSTTSALVITTVATGTTTTMNLPFVADSQPYIDASNNMFIGDNAGNVWTGSLLSSSGNLATKVSWTALNNAAPSPVGANFGSSVTTSGGAGPIGYIDGAYYNGTEYLTLQSTGRLTALEDGPNGWAPLWTSYAGGSEAFSNGGYISSSAVAALPANTVVTNPVQIVNGAVVLPVSVPPSSTTNACAVSEAMYYYYSLTDGAFPIGVFGIGGQSVTGPTDLGSGIAYTPSIALMDGQLRLQGVTSGGPGQALSTQGPPPAGPASWRELF